jgi:ribosome biogenesis GTPase
MFFPREEQHVNLPIEARLLLTVTVIICKESVMTLDELGWNDYFARSYEPFKNEVRIPARITCEHKHLYHILCERGEMTAEVSGKYLHETESRADFPAVGDWVVIAPRSDEKKATIHTLLPRRSHFSRKAILAGGPAYGSGKTEEQILAANIDSVFLVCGLDDDFNLRRIERYLSIAWDSGAMPVIVLNKADLADNIEKQIKEVESIAFGVPIYAVSAIDSRGLDLLMANINKGQTVAFLGSSGVGKSSIINCLLGEDRLKIGALRESDGRGRHTTTYRELLLLPNGGIVIDTPGLRELQIWTNERGLEKAFGDIEELVLQCRFRDCQHTTEPDCAIRQALENRTLDMKRYRNYLRLQKELKHLQIRQDQKESRRVSREFDKRIKRRLKEMEELRKRGLA